MPIGTAKEYRRTLAVQWADEGVRQSVIAERLGATQGSVSQWIKRSKERGKDVLKTKPFPGHPPKLPHASVPPLLAALEEWDLGMKISAGRHNESPMPLPY